MKRKRYPNEFRVAKGKDQHDRPCWYLEGRDLRTGKWLENKTGLPFYNRQEALEYCTILERERI